MNFRERNENTFIMIKTPRPFSRSKTVADSCLIVRQVYASLVKFVITLHAKLSGAV